MSDQFLGEIRIMPYTFAPSGWAFCQGQLLSISQNAALFSLLGTNFGGNGTSNFGLPNLQGNVPVMAGQGPGLSSYVLGQTGGAASVTLNTNQIAGHTHNVQCLAAGGNATTPVANGFAEVTSGRGTTAMYAAAPDGTTNLSAAAVSSAGGGQPHNNMAPYLVLNFCIAMVGIYPTRS